MIPKLPLFMAVYFVLGNILTTQARKSTKVSSNDSHRDKRQTRSSPYYGHSSSTCTAANESVCITPECVEAAASFQKNMDLSVDPCKDFFRYACGGWIDSHKHKIKEGLLYYAVNLVELPEKVDKNIERLMEEAPKRHRELLDTQPYRQMYNFYFSCVSAETNTAVARQAFEFARSLSGFQVEKKFDPSRWDLTQAVLSLMQVNGMPLFELSLDLDPSNSSKWAPLVTLPRKYGLTPSLHGRQRNPEHKMKRALQILEKYFRQQNKEGKSSKNFKNFFESVKTSKSSTKRAKRSNFKAEESVELAGNVDSHLLPELTSSLLEEHMAEERRNLTIANFRKTLRLWNITDIFIQGSPNNSFSASSGTPKDTNPNSKDSYSEEKSALDLELKRHLVDLEQLFLLPLDRMLPTEKQQIIAEHKPSVYNSFNVSQLEEVCPVIRWGYLLHEIFGAGFSESSVVIVHYPEYLTSLCGILKVSDPWLIHWGMLATYFNDVLKELMFPEVEGRGDACIRILKQTFDSVITHLYLNDIDGEEHQRTMEKFSEIFSNTISRLRRSLETATWLSTPEKDFFLRKLKFMDVQVGSLKEHSDIDFVRNTTSDIGEKMSPEDFFDNTITLYRHFRTHLYNIYGQTVSSKVAIWDLTTNPFVTNAFNILTLNTIVVPQAFFVAPHFRNNVPDYLNYGSAGASISHELTHSFDLAGLQFDFTGTFVGPSGQSMISRLLSANDCYINMINDELLKFNLLKIDSELVNDENIADIIGLRNSFRAYKELTHQVPSQRLPSIHLSNDQMFFVSTAQPYCSTFSPIAKLILAQIDEHLPNDLRINSMMMNSEEFRDTFSCPKRDKICRVFNP